MQLEYPPALAPLLPVQVLLNCRIFRLVIAKRSLSVNAVAEKQLSSDGFPTTKLFENFRFSN